MGQTNDSMALRRRSARRSMNSITAVRPNPGSGGTWTTQHDLWLKGPNRGRS